MAVQDGVEQRHWEMKWSNMAKWSGPKMDRSHCKEEQGSANARRGAAPLQGSSVIARRSGREPVKGGVEQC